MASTATDGGIPAYFLYGEAPRAPDEQILHVETIAHRSARYRWKIDPHLHRNLHQLLYVQSGRGTLLAECDATEYRPPAVIVMPAGAVHGFEFEPGTRGFVVSIAEEMPRMLSRREAGVGTLFDSPAVIQLRGDALRATDVEQGFILLAREFGRSAPGRTLALQGWLQVILANILRLSAEAFAESPAEAALGRARALAARFRQLVEEGFRENRSVADYAAALSVSESRLRHACLSVTEQSPMQIIHARILLEAKRELLHTNRPVNQIAYALGFEDAAYFTRFFSQRTALSPSRFRARGPRR